MSLFAPRAYPVDFALWGISIGESNLDQLGPLIEAGAAAIKIFPANIVGPEFISSIRELFQDAVFIPTGGVEIDEDNVRSWFKAGVKAVGFGSRLISKDIL